MNKENPVPLSTVFYNTLGELSQLAIEAENIGTDSTVVTTDPNQEYINVSEYGAVGDGVTDDTPAIQSALDAAATSGGKSKVLIPAEFNCLVKPVSADACLGGRYYNKQMLVCLWVDSNVLLRVDGKVTLAPPTSQAEADFGVVVIENKNSFQVIAGNDPVLFLPTGFVGTVQGMRNYRLGNTGTSTTLQVYGTDAGLATFNTETTAGLLEVVPNGVLLEPPQIQLYINGIYYDVISLTANSVTIDTSIFIDSIDPKVFYITTNVRDSLVTIEGRGTIDCNRLVGQTYSWNKILAVRLYRCSNFVVKDINIINSYLGAIQIGFSQYGLIDVVTVMESTALGSALDLDVCKDVRITNSTFVNNSTSKNGIRLWACKDIYIDGNTAREFVESSAGCGISFIGNGMEFRETYINWEFQVSGGGGGPIPD
jgi:hypothetical protein